LFIEGNCLPHQELSQASKLRFSFLKKTPSR
jgi:hypothetical protein